MKYAKGSELNRWFLGILSALSIVLLGGVAHGVLSNRWGIAEDTKLLGKQLNEIPMEIGPWKCEEEGKLDDRVRDMLEATGYISRVYVHQATGESVNVFLVFGPKGPIAVHTPEICYSARAVTQTSERQSVACDYDEKEGTIWKLGFETNTLDKRKMSVYYGWTDGGPWQAAKSPRFWRTDFLYKVQTSCQATGKKEDSTDEFFKFFMPEARKVMRKI
ncbi:MAG: exosortase-associated EpsI family protein [Planctomycetota bacterium]|nr:EpsI family protein [Planctomycetaceae bacterium]MCE2813609.1 EpsI family protein [Planctomycetaceae bacterium]